jgi:hypothetical protein
MNGFIALMNNYSNNPERVKELLLAGANLKATGKKAKRHSLR